MMNCPRNSSVSVRGVKWTDFAGYGFNLHAEKGKAGQFIGKVDDGSPAQAAGLKEGDRIIEVNGVNIGNENHQQVVTRVKSGGEETSLLVVDSSSDDWFKEHKVVIKGDLPEVVFGSARRDAPSGDEEEEPEPRSEPEREPTPEPEREPTPEPEREPTPEPEPVVEKEEVVPVSSVNGVNEDDQHKPRLCHLKLWPHFDGYGFNLHAERDKAGQYIGLVDDDSPASTAGLLVHDRIVEVNGFNVEKENHVEVINLIKVVSGETRLLVVDPDVDMYYREKGFSVSSSMPQTVYIATPDAAEASIMDESQNDVVDAAMVPVELEKEKEKETEKENGESEEVDGTLADFNSSFDSPPAEEEKEDVKSEEEEVIPSSEVEPVPEVVEVEEPLPEDLNDNTPEVIAAPEPEPEPAVAEKEEPVAQPASAPSAMPAKPSPQSSAPAQDSNDGLALNMSVSEMKERLKAKKRQDPRMSKMTFEQKYKQFQRM